MNCGVFQSFLDIIEDTWIPTEFWRVDQPRQPHFQNTVYNNGWSYKVGSQFFLTIIIVNVIIIRVYPEEQYATTSVL